MIKKIFLWSVPILLLCISIFFLTMCFIEELKTDSDIEVYDELVSEYVTPKLIIRLPDDTDVVASDTTDTTEPDTVSESDTTTSQGDTDTAMSPPVSLPPQYITPQDVDIHSLKNINSDVGGWVCLDNSPINYPVMNSEGNYYLKRNIYGNETVSGSIYTYKTQNWEDPDNLDKNLMMFGHTLKNSSMFSYINTILGNKSLLRNGTNRYVYVYTEKCTYKYEIFSVYKIEKSANFTQVNFKDNDDFLEFCNTIYERSIYQGEKPDFNENSHLLTLATCPYRDSKNYRTVLHAILVGTEIKN